MLEDGEEAGGGEGEGAAFVGGEGFFGWGEGDDGEAEIPGGGGCGGRVWVGRGCGCGRDSSAWQLGVGRGGVIEEDAGRALLLGRSCDARSGRANGNRCSGRDFQLLRILKACNGSCRVVGA